MDICFLFYYATPLSLFKKMSTPKGLLQVLPADIAKLVLCRVNVHTMMKVCRHSSDLRLWMDRRRFWEMYWEHQVKPAVCSKLERRFSIQTKCQLIQPASSDGWENFQAWYVVLLTHGHNTGATVKHAGTCSVDIDVIGYRVRVSHSKCVMFDGNRLFSCIESSMMFAAKTVVSMTKKPRIN